MAHTPTAHGESGRNETVDLSSSAPKTTCGMHLTGYVGLLIAALLLIAVLFLQGASTG